MPARGITTSCPRARSWTPSSRRRRPRPTFQVDLPATPDFRLHRTFVTPPALSRGFYVIVASPRADFSTGQNPLRAAGMLVTDLVLHIRQTEDGGIEARAVSGTMGQPAAGASVALWRYDWQSGHTRAATAGPRRTGSSRSPRSPTGTGNRTSCSRGAATTSRSIRASSASGTGPRPRRLPRRSSTRTAASTGRSRRCSGRRSSSAAGATSRGGASCRRRPSR